MSETAISAALTQRFGETPEVPEGLAKIPALNALAARGSCRSFTSQTVDTDVLDTLCALALCAPSKSDLQQRDILIVTDPALLAALKSLLDAQAWIAEAPAMVVFLANNRRQRQVQMMHNQPFPNDHLDAFFNASVDAGIALAFFMSAAEAAGLGCCPISTIRNHLPRVKDLLVLPDHVFPVAGMAVGYPSAASDVSARLPLSKTVHRDRFSDITEADIKSYDTRRLAGQNGPGWSEAKAKMYAAPQRTDFAAFLRSIGFTLE
ncbi:nitroreductase family protein [uncultured Roseobacter sp.]|uniref:nitroreductase family protein n=1 Tax=uncultured Roseobacter sp. TaxID=114847 RepID=UPI00263A27DA|nr:nitroreductase family protein [uncultured Roseobacter sp.]